MHVASVGSAEPTTLTFCEDWESQGVVSQVLLALGTYMIVAFLFNLLDEVRPVFASAPVEVGGLGLSINVLSWPLSFGGLCFILFACFGRHLLCAHSSERQDLSSCIKHRPVFHHGPASVSSHGVYALPCKNQLLGRELLILRDCKSRPPQASIGMFITACLRHAVAGYETLYKAVGGIWCSRLGMIVFILAALMVPLASLLPQTLAAVLPELFLAMAINSAADMAAYSGSNVLVSLSSACQLGQHLQLELDVSDHTAPLTSLCAHLLCPNSVL